MLKVKQLQKALHFAKSKFTIATKGVERKSSRIAIIYPVDEQLIITKTKNTKNQRCQKNEKKQNKKEENEEEQQNNNIFYSNFLIYHLN
ncbi:hypothetical protein ACQ4LE_004001 [Meloidogyne hapla]